VYNARNSLLNNLTEFSYCAKLTDAYCSGQGRVAGSCEHGEGNSGAIKGAQFLEYLRGY